MRPGRAEPCVASCACANCEAQSQESHPKIRRECQGLHDAIDFESGSARGADRVDTRATGFGSFGSTVLNMSANRALNGVVLLLVLGLAMPAHAETGAAAALFDSARDAMKRGNYAKARAQLEESLRLEPAVGTELNLALCEEQLGREVAAWRRLQRVIDTLPRDDERLRIARQHRDELGERLPHVTLVAAVALPLGTVIWLGGTELTPSSLGVSIPVERGELAIRVAAPGYEPREYRLSMATGSREEVSIAAGSRRGPLLPHLLAGGTPPHASPSARSRAGFVSLGVGGALAIVGSAASLFAIRAKHEMTEACDAKLRCTARGLDAAGRGEALALASTLTFAASGVTLVAGALLLLSSESVAEPSRPRAEISVFVHPWGAGVSGRFR